MVSFIFVFISALLCIWDTRIWNTEAFLRYYLYAPYMPLAKVWNTGLGRLWSDKWFVVQKHKSTIPLKVLNHNFSSTDFYTKSGAVPKFSSVFTFCRRCNNTDLKILGTCMATMSKFVNTTSFQSEAFLNTTQL